MKGLLYALLLLTLFQCGNEEEIDELGGCGSSACATEAEVVDMTGMDGCGLLFKLADGSLLEPMAAINPEDVLFGFTLQAGQRVKISWEDTLALSACMAGPIVTITCITICHKPAE